MRRSPAGVLAVLTALSTLGALATTVVPASAEVVSVTDATGDVQQLSTRPGRAEGLSDRFTDIEATTLDHRAGKVVMTVDVVDVEKVAPSELQGQINTPDGKRYLARVQYRPEAPTQAFLQDLDDPGSELPCDVRAAVRTEADQIVVQVPRACLGRPETVQFGARHLTNFLSSTLVDDARRSQRPTSLEQPIKIGPRKVARG